MIASSPSMAPELFRDSMRQWATGITVVTAADAAGRPHGFTASSFTAVSMAPPLVLVCLDRNANCLETFRASAWFAVHVLRDDQEGLAVRFARKDADKFAGSATRSGLGGAPLLDGTLTRLECRTADRIAAGDHVILLGEVHRACVREGEPLLYYQRAFHRIRPPAAKALPAGAPRAAS
ncbi:flavin reductase family protein [Streptomyces sp. NPDC001135]